MKFATYGGGNLSLEMKTVEDYKKIAQGYRCSDEYSKMLGLYPILRTSIKDCKGEELVN